MPSPEPRRTPPSAPVLPLADDLVRLEPLGHEHAPALREAASGPRDSYGFTEVPAPETVDAYLDGHLRRAAGGDFWPMAQVDAATGRVVGVTCFLAARRWPGEDRLLAIEVGGTWLHPDAQGTAINSAAKRLLMRHAFEDLGVARLDIKTDARNARARAGIEAVGARFEGVLRSWQPSALPGEAGLPRDTAMYSVVAAEWPEVERLLGERIAAKLALPG